MSELHSTHARQGEVRSCLKYVFLQFDVLMISCFFFPMLDF